MVSGKQRLYIALYARGGTGYHWELLVGPKDESDSSQGKRYHVRERFDPATGRNRWDYQGLEIPMQPTGQLLVRITIAKVEKPNRLEQLLSQVVLVQDDPNWRCRHWVRDGLLALKTDGKSLGTAQLDWDYLESMVNWFVELKKSQHRFDGQGDWNMMKVPTYDVLEGRETME